MTEIACAARTIPLDAPASRTRALAARSPGASRPLPRAMLALGVVGAAAGLLLTACSSATPRSAGAQRAAIRAPAAGGVGAPALSNGPGFDGTHGQLTLSTQAKLIRLAPASQSLIYTASLSIRAKDVTAMAARMTSLVTSVGGYVAGQRETISPAGHGPAQVSLTLKIPVAAYNSTLASLRTYGTQLSFNSQATDVTQQVADVASRVASAQDAIRQLRALLARAGSVGSLLSVQNEINAQESALESLLAQQQALAHQTSYGTVSVLIVGHRAAVVKKPKKSSHGFVAGLGAGWRAFVGAVTWLLTALGAALPFIVLIALLAGIALGGRRRLARRRTPPAADPPAAA